MALLYTQNDIPGAAEGTLQSASDMVGSKPITVSSLPMRKRKQENGNIESYEEGNDEKKMKVTDNVAKMDAESNCAVTNTPGLKPIKRAPMSKAREIRLEQNRKAARESRRRKKIMVEELQRSVIFFSRANSTLKQQNEELQRILLQAQSQIQTFENGHTTQPATASTVAVSAPTESITTTPASDPAPQAPDSNVAVKESRDAQAHQAVATAQAQQVQKISTMTHQTQAHHAAQAAATQAMFESQGFPPAAARAAAQTFVAAPATPQISETKNTQVATTASASSEAPFTNAPAQTGIAMTPNPWPFIVTMAPGQMPLAGNVQQQVVAAGTPNKQNSATGKADFNQYFAMPPFLTTVLGTNPSAMGIPMMQLAGMNDGNNPANVSLETMANQKNQTNTAVTNTKELKSNTSPVS